MKVIILANRSSSKICFDIDEVSFESFDSAKYVRRKE